MSTKSLSWGGRQGRVYPPKNNIHAALLLFMRKSNAGTFSEMNTGSAFGSRMNQNEESRNGEAVMKGGGGRLIHFNTG